MREISNRIATSGNSKQERDKKGCGRDGRDRRNPIARITDKYERLERSSGSHPPSTISPLSLSPFDPWLRNILQEQFFFLEGGNNRKRLDAFSSWTDSIRMELCVSIQVNEITRHITRYIFIKHVLSNYYIFTDSEKF